MSDEGRRIGVWATEQQWAHCVSLMTFAAMHVAKDCESDDEKVAYVARQLAPSLRECKNLIERISDAVPRIIAK